MPWLLTFALVLTGAGATNFDKLHAQIDDLIMTPHWGDTESDILQGIVDSKAFPSNEELAELLRSKAVAKRLRNPQTPLTKPEFVFFAIAQALDPSNFEIVQWSQSTDPVTVYDRGVALMNLGRFAEAKEAFARAVEIGGMGSTPQLQLGVCQWRLGRLEEAARIIESVTLLEPHNERAGRLLNTVRAGLGSDFYRMAMGGTSVTDKITTHQYHILYDQVLARYRNTPGVHLLEIGLGCDMSYGPGASLGLWRRYLSAPDRKISFFENARKCAERFRHEVERDGGHMFIGQQGNVSDLSQVDQWAPFDIIIDDGSHRMRDQVTSWHYLWKHVKPGGVYVIEDLQTSWDPEYNGVHTADVNMFLDRTTPENNTYTRVAHTLFHLVRRGNGGPTAGPQTIHDCDMVTCVREACAFHKSRAPA